MKAKEKAMELTYHSWLKDNGLKSDNLINRGLWRLHIKWVRIGIENYQSELEKANLGGRER